MTLPRRQHCVLLLASVALFASGCGSEDGIQSYKVPKTSERDAKPRGNAYRILGTMYPANNPVWFFKFSATVEQVAKYETDFDKLAASVKLQADPSAMPSFALPEGWKKTGPRTSKVGFTTNEVLKFGPAEALLEVTITSSGGELKANVKRWADQVGADYEPDDLVGMAKPFDAAGGTGLRVDVRGPQNPAGGPMMKPR